MDTKKRVALISSFSILLLLIILLIYFVDPNKNIPIENLLISPLIIFYILASLTIALFTYIVFSNFIRALISIILIDSLLFLQFLKINNILYILLLTAIAILLDVFFKKEEKNKKEKN